MSDIGLSSREITPVPPPSADDLSRARLAVCSHARDVTEAAVLLEMLGLL